MISRFVFLLVVFAMVCFAGCDSSFEEDCLMVSPQEDFSISGRSMTMNFTPESKTYAVTNSCSEDIVLSVEEEVRWLDVDIAAFGGGGNERGSLIAGTTIDVVVEVRYGSDDPERLNQLAAGNYRADLRFDDVTNDNRILRSVDVTVN